METMITINDFQDMLDNSYTYNEMDILEKRELLKDLFTRYIIINKGGL